MEKYRFSSLIASELCTMVHPPGSEEELLQRARALSGMTLAELAHQLHWSVPDDLLRDKGWQGQLLEAALGTTASTKAEPDFQHLGIELKSLPINEAGKPQESTFVCRIPLLDVGRFTWHTSYVYRKLARVLWMPIVVASGQSIAMRRLASPLLWSPSPQQEAILTEDWQELTDKISMGQLEQITAHHGRYLQVRPKAAHGRSLCKGLAADGQVIQTLPRGFYLRPTFTEQLLREHFVT